MAKTPSYQSAWNARQKAAREADPEKMAAYRAKRHAAQARLKDKREADPEKMAAYRERRRAEEARRRARIEADPERAEAERQKKARYEADKREAARQRERKPSSPKPSFYQPWPDIKDGPIFVSSPEMTYRPAPQTKFCPPLPKIEQPTEPPPSAARPIERTGWKPDARIQAILDAAKGNKVTRVDMRKGK